MRGFRGPCLWGMGVVLELSYDGHAIQEWPGSCSETASRSAAWRSGVGVEFGPTILTGAVRDMSGEQCGRASIVLPPPWIDGAATSPQCRDPSGLARPVGIAGLDRAGGSGTSRRGERASGWSDVRQPPSHDLGASHQAHAQGPPGGNVGRWLVTARSGRVLGATWAHGQEAAPATGRGRRWN
jgi:hypothetical protein